MARERRRPQAQAMTTPLELWAKATESQELREQLQEEEWAHKPIKKKGTVAESLGQWSFVNNGGGPSIQLYRMVVDLPVLRFKLKWFITGPDRS